jgi:hypothetical protein
VHGRTVRTAAHPCGGGSRTQRAPAHHRAAHVASDAADLSAAH